MTITRETLELAAKAAGYAIAEDGEHLRLITDAQFYLCPFWSPEHDDGDSARLRTDLGLNAEFDLVVRFVAVIEGLVDGGEAAVESFRRHNNDKHAALRYATLMVAAEIGRRMK